jgi:hypothetical protein
MDWIMGVGTWVFENAAMLLQVVGAFAILARYTPNTTDDKIAQHLADGINFIAMNNGKAKNV